MNGKFNGAGFLWNFIWHLWEHPKCIVWCSSASPICSFTLTITTLIQSDTTIISQICITINTVNVTFTSMVWDDWMLSADPTKQQRSSYFKYRPRELIYELDHNAQWFHRTCILRGQSVSLVNSKPVTSPEYVCRFALDVSTSEWRHLLNGNMDIYL